MGEELTKLEIGDISKLIAAIYITDTDFRKILLKSVMGAFKTSHQNTNIQYGFGGTKPDQHAIDYLQERVFILSDKTTSKLEGDLRFELLEGLKNNESISAITKRLDGIFSDMMPYQLERIARTEILNAQNAGRMSAYEKSGAVSYKMWQAAINNARTAADSKRLHGQIQPIDKPFVDPKTGDTFMHPPNRPQCRCTLIPLRKLPDDVITAGGQLYAADKKVGKIEIDVESLNKTEKRIWIKPTEKKIGHWRKIKSISRKPDIKPEIEKIELREGINNIDNIIDIDKDFEEQIKHILLSGSWDINKSEMFNRISDYRGVDVHISSGKIYAVINATQHKRYKSVKINGLEVNPDMRRQGYGIKVMKDITQKYIDDDNCKILELESGGDESDKFYDAIGMKKVPGKGETIETTNRYEGDKKWMKEFLKSISKKH